MEIVAMYSPGTTAIVVNYRTPDDLNRFVQSFKDSGSDAELVIVNVDPTDQDIKVAEAAPFSQHIVALANVGYAKACNRAAVQTSREIIAFFNADTVLSPGVIEQCADALIEHDDWAVVGPRQVNKLGRITHAGILGSNSKPVLRGWMEMDRGQYDEVVESAVSVSGSAYFIKRRVWQEMARCPLYREVDPNSEGAFLTCFHYWNETALSYHVRAHGWKVVYLGTAKMQHEWHQASQVGGVGEQAGPQDQALFRRFCSHHGIDCD